jgi:hypothetical protein
LNINFFKSNKVGIKLKSIWYDFWYSDNIFLVFLKPVIIFPLIPISFACSPIIIPVATVIFIVNKVRGPIPKAKILEEICHSGIFRKTMRGSSKGLTWGEIQVLQSKAFPIQIDPIVFPIKDKANPKEIEQWMNHPRINVPDADLVLLRAVSASVAIPTKTMEGILRRLLDDQFGFYYNSAKTGLIIKKKKTEAETNRRLLYE